VRTATRLLEGQCFANHAGPAVRLYARIEAGSTITRPERETDGRIPQEDPLIDRRAFVLISVINNGYIPRAFFGPGSLSQARLRAGLIETRRPRRDASPASRHAALPSSCTKGQLARGEL
jgi:hypothetical protein